MGPEPNNNIIQYHPEEIPLGEAHDPLEESEIQQKIQSLSRKEARKLWKESGFSMKHFSKVRKGGSNG